MERIIQNELNSKRKAHNESLQSHATEDESPMLASSSIQHILACYAPINTEVTIGDNIDAPE